MKAIRSISTITRSRPYTPDQASTSSFSANTSPVRTRLSVSPPPPRHPLVLASVDAPEGTQGTSVESDIDFSPAVGVVSPHPIPLSSNGGATLDWTGSASEDDRDKRWPLSIAKRRHRDKHALGASKPVVEQQESLYASKYVHRRGVVRC
jgi:hypothetical protein